ncbi:hypothetical protein D3C77_550920 [compost metagenome]
MPVERYSRPQIQRFYPGLEQRALVAFAQNHQAHGGLLLAGQRKCIKQVVEALAVDQTTNRAHDRPILQRQSEQLAGCCPFQQCLTKTFWRKC